MEAATPTTNVIPSGPLAGLDPASVTDAQLDTPLGELGFGQKEWAALVNAGLETVDELLPYFAPSAGGDPPLELAGRLGPRGAGLVPAVGSALAAFLGVTPPAPAGAGAEADGKPSAGESLRLIIGAEEEVEEARFEMEEAKARAKAKKDVWELKVERLQRVIRDQKRDYPLFDREADAAGAGSADESWRGVPLSEALEGIPAKQIEALAEAGITTVGALQDWTAGGKDLTDVRGVGPAKADAIADAMAEFWKRSKAAEGATTVTGTVAGKTVAVELTDSGEAKPGPMNGRRRAATASPAAG